MENQLCQACEVGRLHYAVRDVTIAQDGATTFVPSVAGFFCDHCDEIDFDNATDAADRYAAASDALLAQRQIAVADRLKKTR